MISDGGMSASSNSRDALLGSPNSHGSSGVFIPKSYGTGPIKVGDARRSEQVKSNHSGEVPHFVYHGLLDVPDSDDSDGFHHHNAESILALDPMKGKSTLVATSFNVINGVVGAGMIGTPHVINQQGFVPGLLGLVFIALITYFTMIIQIEVGRSHGVFSYEMLAELAFGKKGFHFLVGFMLINSFGVCVAYACLIQLVIPPLIQGFIVGITPDEYKPYITPGMILNVLGAVILFPLCLKRNLASFEKLSGFSILVLITLLTVLAINFCDLGEFAAIHTEPTEKILWSFGNEYIQGLGTLAFAFSCQQYSFHAFESLDDPTEQRWSTVAFVSLVTACVMALIFSATGYLSYGSKTKANVLDNISSESGYGDLAKLMLGIKMILTFPLDFFVIRYCVQRMLQKLCCSREWNSNDPYQMGKDKKGRPKFTPIITRDNVSGKGHAKDFSCLGHFVLTLVLFAAVMGAAFEAMSAQGETSGLALVLQLSGGVGAIFVGFVFPAACFLKLGIVRMRMPNCCDTLYFYFAWFVFLFGIGAGVLSTGATVWVALTPK